MVFLYGGLLPLGRQRCWSLHLLRSLASPDSLSRPNQLRPDLKHGDTEGTEGLCVEIPLCSLWLCVLKTIPASGTDDPTAKAKGGIFIRGFVTTW